MIKETIDKELVSALKNRDTLRLGVFRLLKAAFKNEEIAKKHPLALEEEIIILDRQAKQREDAILIYEKAGRNDLLLKEKDELSVINEFRPKKMTETEIRTYVKNLIGKAEDKTFGSIMKQVMSDLKGKADGSIVSKVVKDEIGE
ncbi:hypothetical protein AUK11_03985 [bacterium CG2_30_37_16]|nr:MAG: hypothetical protein AUK11_03985 [bacterium CG2_30_37_16]PIP30242.1 MAG: glutamyl-tRNA amidotransferase [bacterium (Candidatus Howlettbacteria) CG23_combo_of_CG06-09_8_20_14_all_37_9]PIX98938.1 MAG: glutamyl-tRNA amidotransferase [bacterium (Candidatus Howlettbacteria) CG_4_10_14_3_um_filter_37_10]PJB07228.1 MAG: glutamyl-tRNA amidotransferase [bacterium (Candidatus Howlettbacteria) CG_4_9_14_3_um_filter_37_10]